MGIVIDIFKVINVPKTDTVEAKSRQARGSSFEQKQRQMPGFSFASTGFIVIREYLQGGESRQVFDVIESMPEFGTGAFELEEDCAM